MVERSFAGYNPIGSYPWSGLPDQLHPIRRDGGMARPGQPMKSCARCGLRRRVTYHAERVESGLCRDCLDFATDNGELEIWDVNADRRANPPQEGRPPTEDARTDPRSAVA